MSGHTMRVEFEPYGRVTLTPVCHEPEGAVCRVTCSEGCEEYGYPVHEHKLEPVPYCNAVEFITADDAIDQCSAKMTFSLKDGMPIRVEWTGDGYTWEPLAVTHV